MNDKFTKILLIVIDKIRASCIISLKADDLKQRIALYGANAAGSRAGITFRLILERFLNGIVTCIKTCQFIHICTGASRIFLKLIL